MLVRGEVPSSCAYACKASSHSVLDAIFVKPFVSLQVLDSICVYTGALQHSLSVHVDKEQVIDPGLDFNEPEEQLWEVEEHVAGADDDDCLHTHFDVELHGVLIQLVVVQVLK